MSNLLDFFVKFSSLNVKSTAMQCQKTLHEFQMQSEKNELLPIFGQIQSKKCLN